MDPGISSEAQYADRIFRDTHLEQVQLASSEFYGCTFVACSFAEAILRQCRFVDCTFQQSDLSLIQVPNSTFSATRFEDCRAIGINWTLADWGATKLGEPLAFRRCAISHSTFIGLELKGLKIVDSIAVDVDFREADLTRADFAGTDLSQSLFLNTNLTGADLSKARNYHIAPGQNVLKQAKFSLPEALSLLYGLDIDLIEGD